MRTSFLFRTEKGGVFGEFCYLNAELSAVSGSEGMKFDYPGPQGVLGGGRRAGPCRWKRLHPPNDATVGSSKNYNFRDWEL